MLVESEFQNVTLGQQTWRYHDSGQGQPIVLFHGFPDLPHSYAGIAAALNEAGFRTILPYLRGYHRDTIVEGRAYDTLHIAEDAIGLLDALELPSAVLVGHDWGASVVWGAAAIAPDRVDAVVPIAIPHPATLKPGSLKEAVQSLILGRHFVYFKTPWASAGTRRNENAYIDELYTRWAPDWTGPERDAAIARFKTAIADPAVLEGTIDYYRALGGKVDRRLASKITAPVLMVAGSNDFGGLLKEPFQDSLGRLAEGSAVWTAEGAGHWPHREQESQFVARLLEFLRERG